ncbi:DUF2398 family protein [Promicromonospora sp. NPDC057138]|uniref:DUF2398 family protein n=1 Tax=Promicromonospora sp. NPDC057138 TaxID=3346031 RepID=UPI003631D69C
MSDDIAGAPVTGYAPAPNRTTSSEDIPARLTFLRFLVRPLVSAHVDRPLFRDIQRYAKQIDGYCRRLDYQRTRMGDAVRLVRNPVMGTVSAPPPRLDLPSRRVLTLTTLLAAACEEVEGGVTLVRLSEIVAEITRSTDRALTPYDPDRLTERRALAKAAEQLEHWGILRKRATLVADLQEWTDSRTGIGAGYDVDRDALLLFVTPGTITLAAYQEDQLAQAPQVRAQRFGTTAWNSALDAAEPPESEPAEDPGQDEESPAAIWETQRQATRVVRHLRALVETPALLYGDLLPDEAELARVQRGLRAETVLGLIGGSIEARSEGLVWISTEVDCPATVDWPTHKTESWAALMIADKAGRDGHRDADGFVHLDTRDVDHIVEDLLDWKGHLFRKDLQGRPAETRTAAEEVLRWLGMLRTGPDGSWRLSPVMGRYRDPELIEPSPATHQDDLFTHPAHDATGDDAYDASLTPDSRRASSDHAASTEPDGEPA